MTTKVKVVMKLVLSDFLYVVVKHIHTDTPEDLAEI